MGGAFGSAEREVNSLIRFLCHVMPNSRDGAIEKYLLVADLFRLRPSWVNELISAAIHAISGYSIYFGRWAPGFTGNGGLSTVGIPLSRIALPQTSSVLQWHFAFNLMSNN